MNNNNENQKVEGTVVEASVVGNKVVEEKKSLFDKPIGFFKKNGKKIAAIAGGVLLVGVGFLVGKQVGANNAAADISDEEGDTSDETGDDYGSESNTEF